MVLENKSWLNVGSNDFWSWVYVFLIDSNDGKYRFWLILFVNVFVINDKFNWLVLIFIVISIFRYSNNLVG